MAVTKRLRFEILKRDGFRCYYCGTRGIETGQGLTIDHVVPVALGGTDDPANLVSACGDCNSGKSSVPADAETVADVDQLAAQYARARALALRALQADINAETAYLEEVWSVWDGIAPSYANDPSDLESIATGWHARGVPIEAVKKAIRIAWDSSVGKAQKPRYAAGVVNRLMDGVEDRTRALVEGESVVWNAGYYSGWKDGILYQESREYDTDLVAMHIDGVHSAFWKVLSDAA